MSSENLFASETSSQPSSLAGRDCDILAEVSDKCLQLARQPVSAVSQSVNQSYL